ncbi:MAG TPA: hypothetical protein ENH10_03955 [Bacteroidetes bacterium]|nr:hypothetical protein [Bacteroidota bacterium]HEX04297.1 hypothetical protein [Bacteroidota bacterium]
MITRVLRLLFSGALFGAGYALGRLLLMPLMLTALAGAGWAFGWSSLHHVQFLQGVQHVVFSLHAMLMHRVG